MTAFKIEFEGKNAFGEVQMANSIFFVVNVLSIIFVLRAHTITATFEMAGEYTVSNMVQAVKLQLDSKNKKDKK